MTSSFKSFWNSFEDIFEFRNLELSLQAIEKSKPNCMALEYRIYAIHSRTIFSNFSLFGATIFQIYEVKSATMFQGRLCFKGDYIMRKYGN